MISLISGIKKHPKQNNIRHIEAMTKEMVARRDMGGGGGGGVHGKGEGKYYCNNFSTGQMILELVV